MRGIVKKLCSIAMSEDFSLLNTLYGRSTQTRTKMDNPPEIVKNKMLLSFATKLPSPEAITPNNKYKVKIRNLKLNNDLDFFSNKLLFNKNIIIEKT
tara:strand:- start:153863 stop:154153 length:291 start_codon:yes stop_codon:yes gene_type:complete